MSKGYICNSAILPAHRVYEYETRLSPYRFWARKNPTILDLLLNLKKKNYVVLQ